MTKETPKAIALFYDGMRTPTLTAKGSGYEAEEIIRIAKEAGVPLCDNAPLVELLSKLELGDSIPEQVFIAVANILAFAYELQFSSPSSHSEQPPDSL